MSLSRALELHQGLSDLQEKLCVRRSECSVVSDRCSSSLKSTLDIPGFILQLTWTQTKVAFTFIAASSIVSIFN